MSVNNIVRRSVIITEHDYQTRFFKSARRLYDSVNWQPLTLDMMEKENMFSVLKDSEQPLPWDFSTSFRWYSSGQRMFTERDIRYKVFYPHRDRSFRSNYCEWNFYMRSDGHFCCRAKRGLWTTMGIATVEKDIN